jgi:hypothetical protein
MLDGYREGSQEAWGGVVTAEHGPQGRPTEMDTADLLSSQILRA